VKAAKLEVLGRGEREPVTGAKCPTSMLRPKAIVCLQPDRRVVVEARGLVK
jgi:OmpA-OmpF porin, OOP family